MTDHAIQEPSGQQRCPRCEALRPLALFAPSARGRSGTYCRDCINAAYREKRPMPELVCVTCKKVIANPRRSDQRFCGPNCKAAETRRRQRAGEAPPPRPILPPRHRTGEIDSADCTRCGRSFTYARKRRSRLLCDACRQSSEGRRTDGLRYGLTVAEATALRADCQNCAVCGRDNPGPGYHNWHIDHDHGTGAFRAVLCGPCNIGIGHFKDDPELLRSAAAYLRKHQVA